jgi:hypothetical protein
MTDSIAQSSQVQQTIKGFEQSMRNTTPNSVEAAGALQKMQQELAGEIPTLKTDPTISSAVAAQLQSDGFMIVAGKDGNLAYSSQTSDQSPSATPVRKPEESDFVKFAEMMPKIAPGSTVDAKDFAADFGDQNAAILQSLGLQSITSANNGQYQAEFANSGAVPMGTDTLEYAKSISFNLANTSAGTTLDKIKGLKGKEGALNPTLSQIVIAPEDMQAKQWTVNVTGKELMVSGTEVVQVPDGQPSTPA